MWGHRHWGGMRRGWLRPWVISMIGRSPKNGAEIIDEIEKMSWGGWRPSPGSIYPLLKDMVDEGAIRQREDGRYELTDKGKDEGIRLILRGLSQVQRFQDIRVQRQAQGSSGQVNQTVRIKLISHFSQNFSC